jgi:cell division protein ZapE
MLIAGVPSMDDARNDEARRFINRIDALYDRNVKLIISAADVPGRLYRGRRLAAALARTASRLEEMQSHGYLARPHQSG